MGIIELGYKHVCYVHRIKQCTVVTTEQLVTVHVKSLEYVQLDFFPIA
jgi:hypothetical protein